MSYEQRVVAYIDILGFQNVIDNFTLDGIVRIFAQLEDTKLRLGLPTPSNAIGKVITSFSDHIVISYPFSSKGAFQSLLVDLYVFQRRLLEQGLAFRGAVDVGGLYHKGNIVFGPALVSAYKLENRLSIYPRIIFSEHAYNWGSQNPSIRPQDDDESGGMPRSFEILIQSISKDLDGCYFLDVFNIISTLDEPYDDSDWELALSIISKIIENLKSDEIKSDPAIHAKWTWLLNKWKDSFPDMKLEL